MRLKNFVQKETKQNQKNTFADTLLLPPGIHFTCGDFFFFFFSKHRSFSKQRLSFRAMFLFLELKNVMGLTVSLEKSVSRGMPETSQNSIPHEVQEEHAQTLSLALSVHFSDTFLCCEKEF